MVARAGFPCATASTSAGASPYSVAQRLQLRSTTASELTSVPSMSNSTAAMSWIPTSPPLNS